MPQRVVMRRGDYAQRAPEGEVDIDHGYQEIDVPSIRWYAVSTVHNLLLLCTLQRIPDAFLIDPAALPPVHTSAERVTDDDRNKYSVQQPVSRLSSADPNGCCGLYYRRRAYELYGVVYYPIVRRMPYAPVYSLQF